MPEPVKPLSIRILPLAGQSKALAGQARPEEEEEWRDASCW